MKLATYRPADPQSPAAGIGAVVDDRLVDLNYAFASYLFRVLGESRARALAGARIPRDMVTFLRGGPAALADAGLAVRYAEDNRAERGIDGERLSYVLDEVRLLAPISRPGKILAAGKNYADHAAEGSAGDTRPRPFPVGFVKVSSAVAGPDDPVPLPHVTAELDYEVELAVVIGRAGRYISREDAYDHVVGYTILNDVSARDIQLAESAYGNHMVGKNMDALCPMGPWIVTYDELPDPMHTRIRLQVNGELRQEASTASLIYDIPALIERWSWMTLEPGDVIATGTPAGVALGGKFPYLKVGDVMECLVDGIGQLRNEIVAEAF
jgi:2-keto-4-pentenoate hydratase/2-oxohepta-3-ene-1,7-dioic acid hydratase in catechol pathway